MRITASTDGLLGSTIFSDTEYPLLESGTTSNSARVPLSDLDTSSKVVFKVAVRSTGSSGWSDYSDWSSVVAYTQCGSSRVVAPSISSVAVSGSNVRLTFTESAISICKDVSSVQIKAYRDDGTVYDTLLFSDRDFTASKSDSSYTVSVPISSLDHKNYKVYFNVRVKYEGQSSTLGSAYSYSSSTIDVSNGGGSSCAKPSKPSVGSSL